ncbi:MAG TPA: hypothetical protein VMH02_10380 [Verrucomicrobiae bacterium]|nr:hypothetical protein [Verrucomicrobiae bacterium]
MTLRIVSAPLCALALFVSGCSGGSPSIPSAQGGAGAGIAGSSGAAGAHKKGRVRFTIRVPRRHRIHGRRPAYVSPATASMAVIISRAGKNVETKIVNLTAGSQGCTSSLTNVTCSLELTLPAAKGYTATINTYDDQYGVLSIARNVAFNVSANSDDLIPLTLDGIPAKLVAFSTGSSNSFYVEAMDPDGNLIVGAGAPTFTAAQTAGSAVATITQPSSEAPNTVTLAASSSTYGAETIGVTASYPGDASVCEQTGAVCSLSDAATATRFNQKLFVTNYSEDNVLGFTLPLTGSSQAPANTIPVSAPYPIAADASGTLFVGDYSGGGLYTIAPPYSGVTASTTSGLADPYGIAIDSHSDAFVANSNGASVTEYTSPYSGSPATTITSGVSKPYAVALDSSNNLYVANAGNSTLGVYDAGSYTTQAHSVSLASAPYSELVSGSTLYVGEASDVQAFTLPITSNSPAAVTIPITSASVYGMAVDSSEHLFVSSEDNSTVYEYATPITNAASPVAAITSGLDQPCGVVVDEAGNLYVISSEGGTIAGGISEFEPPFSSSSTAAVVITSGLDYSYFAALVTSSEATFSVTVP